MAVGDDRVSMRQLLAVLFAALLSPALHSLPGQSAAAAGEAGWLSALAALPVFLLLAWGLCRLLRGLPEGTGLAGAFQTVLGGPLGKLVCATYLLWGLVCLSAVLRSYGQRFLSTGYRNVSLGAYVVILLGLAVWLAWGKLSAFARAGEIFYLILCVTVGAVVVFALFNVEAQNVLPLWVEDVPAAARSALPALGTLGYAVFAGFLAGGVRRKPEDGRRAMKWAAAFCLALTAVQFVCMGSFGPALLEKMEAPFFMAAKSIGLRGGFQRVESAVLAVWALSDLALTALLLFSCCAVAQELFGLKNRRSAAIPVAVLGGAGALFLFRDGFALHQFAGTWLVWGNVALGFALPLLVILLGALRRQK